MVTKTKQETYIDNFYMKELKYIFHTKKERFSFPEKTYELTLN